MQISDPEPRRFVTPPARGDVPAIGGTASNRPAEGAKPAVAAAPR